MPPSTYHIESLTEYESDSLEGQALADFALFSDAYDNLKARVAEIAALVNYNTSSWTWVSIDTGHWYPNDIYDSLAQIYSRLHTLAVYTGTYGTLPDFPSINRTWKLCHSDGSDLDAEDYTIDFTEYPGYSPYYNSSHKYYAPKLTCNSLTFYNDIVDIINNLRWAKRIPLYASVEYFNSTTAMANENKITIYADETMGVTLGYQNNWLSVSPMGYTQRGGYGNQSTFPGMDSLLSSPTFPPWLYLYGTAIDARYRLEYPTPSFPIPYDSYMPYAGVCSESTGMLYPPPYTPNWNCRDSLCTTSGVIIDKWSAIKASSDYEIISEYLKAGISVCSTLFKWIFGGDYPTLSNWPTFLVNFYVSDLVAEWSGSSSSLSPVSSDWRDPIYAQFFDWANDSDDVYELPSGNVEMSLDRTIIQMDPDILSAWTNLNNPTSPSAQAVGQYVRTEITLEYSYYIL